MPSPAFPRPLSRFHEILHPLKKDAMQGVLRAREYLVVDRARRHAAAAGEGHNAVLRERLDGENSILVGYCGAAEIRQHAFQCVASPFAEGGTMFLDQLVGDQPL